MLKRTHSLRRKKDIEGVFLNGRKIFGKNLIIRYTKNELNCCRLCVIVSKKVSKKAVERNRLKRQIKYIFKKNTAINFNLDIVIIVSPGLLGQEYQEIKKILNYELAKINN